MYKRKGTLAFGCLSWDSERYSFKFRVHEGLLLYIDGHANSIKQHTIRALLQSCPSRHFAKASVVGLCQSASVSEISWHQKHLAPCDSEASSSVFRAYSFPSLSLVRKPSHLHVPLPPKTWQPESCLWAAIPLHLIYLAFFIQILSTHCR